MKKLVLATVLIFLGSTAVLAQESLDEIVEKLHKADRAEALKMFPELEKRELIGIEDKQVLVEGEPRELTLFFFSLPLKDDVKLLYYCHVLKTGTDKARRLAAEYLQSQPVLVADTLEELAAEKKPDNFDLAAKVLLHFARIGVHEDSPSGFALLWDVRDEVAFVLLEKKIFALIATSSAARQDRHRVNSSAREELRRNVLLYRSHKKERAFVKVVEMRLACAEEQSARFDFQLVLAFVREDLDALFKVLLEDETAPHLKESALDYLGSSEKPEVVDRLRKLVPRIKEPEILSRLLSALGEALRNHCTRKKNGETALAMLKDKTTNKKVKSWARDFFAENAQWEQIRNLAQIIDTFEDEKLLGQLLINLHRLARQLSSEQRADLALDIYERLGNKGLTWVQQLLAGRVDHRFARQLYSRANKEKNPKKKSLYNTLAFKVTSWFQTVEKKEKPQAGKKSESRALMWLSCHRDYRGRWDSDNFAKKCSTDEGACCDGEGHPECDIAVSSLSLLSLLGGGHTHEKGRFSDSVKRGLEWVYSRRKKSGFLGDDNARKSIEQHVLATLAFCEAYAATRDERLELTAAKAVEFLLARQGSEGGWKSSKRASKPNVLTTAWAVLALKTARTAGLEVPESSFKKALAFLDSKSFKRQKAKAGFFQANRLQAVAAAATASILCGRAKHDKAVVALVEILDKNPPGWDDKRGPVYWYFGTYAMQHHGGEKWDKWCEVLKKVLLDRQRIGGCADGSWDPVGPDRKTLGRVGVTALNRLALIIIYRQERAKPPR